jgi:rubrerythrin
MNYQTFGPATFELADPGEDEMGLQMEMSMERTVMSPKSKNKFIIGSLMNILQHVIKTIVFRRIFQTKLIREVEISYFDQSISKIIKKNQEAAFRKIFEAAIFYECLMDKMAVFKKRAIFKAWKQLKKRKLKLLKAILSRKNKKEKAFLSVFLTQLRINTRNVGFS